MVVLTSVAQGVGQCGYGQANLNCFLLHSVHVDRPPVSLARPLSVLTPALAHSVNFISS